MASLSYRALVQRTSCMLAGGQPVGVWWCVEPRNVDRLEDVHGCTIPLVDLTDLVSFALEGLTKQILVLGREEDEQKLRFLRLPRPLLEPGFGLSVVGSPLAACRIHFMRHRLHRRRVHPRGETCVDLRARCRRRGLCVVRHELDLGLGLQAATGQPFEDLRHRLDALFHAAQPLDELLPALDVDLVALPVYLEHELGVLEVEQRFPSLVDLVE
mmetsp:Transcript_99601/g.284709  ORF Transcript_99601/g.284709 Transcript_99601/m.284709 type:complete len:214 (-) Transcript_99601:95-736(-)